jgi:phage shock protein A
MSLLDRVARLFRANVNVALNQLEDPVLLLEQAILDLEAAVVESNKAVAKAVLLHRKNEGIYNQAKKDRDEWQERAKLALKQGKEDLARDALEKSKMHERALSTAQSNLEISTKQVDKLKANLKEIQNKLDEYKANKAAIIARKELAEANQQINALTDSRHTSSVAALFDRVEQDVLSLEIQGELDEELSGNSLSKEFAQLEQATQSNDSLEQLKLEMQREEQLLIDAQLEEQLSQFNLLSAAPEPNVEDPTTLLDLNSDFFN